MANVLIVEDEKIINELIMRNLKLVGHRCEQAYDGKEALKRMKERTYDLILLDVMLPYLSGFELLKYVNGVPVIFITAKDNLEDKLKGLTEGGEDYIVKPFEIMELIARVNIVLRRYQTMQDCIMVNEAVIDLEKRKVEVEGKEIELTPQEFSLLEVLVLNRNIALSREKLLELAWGFQYEGDTRTVDVHIQKLRKKMGLEEQIKTIYKLGYRLEVREGN